MQVIDYWAISVWDGGERHNHTYNFSSKMDADQYIRDHKYDLADNRQLIIIDSYDEFKEFVNGEARRKALSKLSNEEKVILGIKD